MLTYSIKTFSDYLKLFPYTELSPNTFETLLNYYNSKRFCKVDLAGADDLADIWKCYADPFEAVEMCLNLGPCELDQILADYNTDAELRQYCENRLRENGFVVVTAKDKSHVMVTDNMYYTIEIKDVDQYERVTGYTWPFSEEAFPVIKEFMVHSDCCDDAYLNNKVMEYTWKEYDEADDALIDLLPGDTDSLELRNHYNISKTVGEFLPYDADEFMDKAIQLIENKLNYTVLVTENNHLLVHVDEN